jgi:hypothetical protein
LPIAIAHCRVRLRLLIKDWDKGLGTRDSGSGMSD